MNLVAKHAHKSNKSAVFVDRKKAQVAGYNKHKAVPGLIQCWSCKKFINSDLLSLNDGFCPKCNCEIDLEDY